MVNVITLIEEFSIIFTFLSYINIRSLLLLLTLQPYMGFVFCTKSFQTFLSLTSWIQFLNFISIIHFSPRLCVSSLAFFWFLFLEGSNQ